MRDADGDGLSNSAEVNQFGTDPDAADSDGDGLADGEEVDDYGTNPTVADTDDDGLNDSAEILEYETDPSVADTDQDGLVDGAEASDYGANPNDSDTDGDGWDDGEEVNEYGTNPTVADTDDDGLNDSIENQEYETDPTAKHSDWDELADGREVEGGTDPTVGDTDQDGLPDGVEINKTNRFPGANPLQKDIYLEVDYSEKIPTQKVQTIKAEFSDAPVSNPDGTTGINLHVYWDDELQCSGATELNGESPPYSVEQACEGGDWDNRGYYYGRLVDDVEINDEPFGGFAGSHNFYSGTSGSAAVTSQIFMHELGHVLGIRAGGGADSTEVPFSDYPSVMNYNAPNDNLTFSTGDHSDDDRDDWSVINRSISDPPALRFQIQDQKDERE